VSCTGTVAIHTTPARKATHPMASSARRAPGVCILALIPAKNSAIAKSTTPSMSLSARRWASFDRSVAAAAARSRRSASADAFRRY
jgi:hypothetical protein